MLRQCFALQRMNRLIGASAHPVRHHFRKLSTTRLAFISIYPPEGPFQSHEQPTFKTVIPYMRGHSCACPGAKWTGMCRLSRPWRTGLWAPLHDPPLLSPHLHAHPDLSQHHHPGLSPGVQLASAEWIDTLTSPWEVCAGVCMCACLWERGRSRKRRRGGSSPNVNSFSQ